LQIESLLQTANEQRASLQEAKAQLHVLDDSTLVGVIKFFTTQKKDLWLFDEQLHRWRAEELTMTQRAAIERLTRQMRNLHEAINTILALADELKEDTIEKVLAKGDAKRGLEMLVQLWKHEQEG
jgi:folylpolyglutamate synthase/dihydropteroate synthase